MALSNLKSVVPSQISFQVKRLGSGWSVRTSQGQLVLINVMSLLSETSVADLTRNIINLF